MNGTFDKLLRLLNLDITGTDVYRGESVDLGLGRVFGGQVIGQALAAASKTIESRTAHSLHAYFLKLGKTRIPIDYHVERIRDGQSFSVRRVTAFQAGEPIFIMSTSFHLAEEGFDHQAEMPKVEAPEDVTSEIEIVRALGERIPEAMRARFAYDRPIENRTIDPVLILQPEEKAPTQYAWLRAAGSVPPDPVLNQCLLAYVSDIRLVWTCLRPHAVYPFAPGMQMASLDHAMWFHRHFHFDDWLLYAMDSPSASHARGFNRGSIFSRDGRLIASVAQEGLIRYRP